jgi:hypothetical protein
MSRKDFLETNVLDQFESWNHAAQRRRSSAWRKMSPRAICITISAALSFVASSTLILAFSDLWGLSVRSLGRATAIVFAAALAAGVSDFALVFYRSREPVKINHKLWAAVAIGGLSIFASVIALIIKIDSVRKERTIINRQSQRRHYKYSTLKTLRHLDFLIHEGDKHGVFPASFDSIAPELTLAPKQEYRYRWELAWSLSHNRLVPVIHADPTSSLGELPHFYMEPERLISWDHSQKSCGFSAHLGDYVIRFEADKPATSDSALFPTFLDPGCQQFDIVTTDSGLRFPERSWWGDFRALMAGRV